LNDGEREVLIKRLSAAFGEAVDVTPANEQAAHILLPSIDLPEPWVPSPTRVLTVWQDWPTNRPRFVIDESVVGESGEPPRSHSPAYILGQTWREFSFNFGWSGNDPVLAVQLWLTRFTVERS
jgi:hypothetical protein